MSLFTRFKESIGWYFLKKEISSLNRNRTVCNIEDANSIAILYDAYDKDELDLLKKYVAYLRDMRKKVRVLGYFSQGELTHVTYSRLDFEFFTKKDLNWHRKPVASFVNNFLEEEFDILIDLNLADHLPLKFVAANSRARFKIGKFSDEDISLYDMMIHAGREDGLKFFLRQVDSYLLAINKTEPPKVANE